MKNETQIQSFYNWWCPKDILYFLFILTSSSRGINVTFTAFSISTRSGSFTPFFLGWLWKLPVQHTATETIDLCSGTTVNDSPLGNSEFEKSAQIEEQRQEKYMKVSGIMEGVSRIIF